MDNNQRSSSAVNTLGVALIGAAAGAAAVILSDKDKRDRLKSNWQKFMNEGKLKLEEGSQKVKELRDNGQRRIGQEIEKTGKKLLKSDNNK